MPAMIVNGSATGSSVSWPGGKGTFEVAGTFGGATVKLQVLGPDATTWLDVGLETTMTAAGIAMFYCRPGLIRASVSGGSPSGIYADTHHIGSR